MFTRRSLVFWHDTRTGSRRGFDHRESDCRPLHPVSVISTLRTMGPLPMRERAGNDGFPAVAAVLLIGVSLFAVSPVSAAATKHLSCTARVSTSRPRSYTTVTIYVRTEPMAKVSGTLTGSRFTVSMVPTAPANSSGKAWLYQKISAVVKSGVERVNVRVALNGSVGHCFTHFRPVALSGS